MILDYNDTNSNYILRVPRDHARIREFMESHGLNFSRTASTRDEAVLYTDDPYAALTYADNATIAARYQLGDLARAVEASRSLGSTTRHPCPEGLDLFPYQKAGLDYALQRQHSLIGDDPGLGKTPQAIVFANAIAARSVLVVCPASIRLQWAERIRQWSTMEGNYIVYPILKSADGVHPKAEWTIISYDLLRSGGIREALAGRRYDLLIVDEAHYLKTPEAKRTKAVLGAESMFGHCERTLALTGTPLPNRPKECFTLTRALAWDAIGYMGQKEFESRYNFTKTIRNRKGAVVRAEEKTGRLLELQNRLRAHYMVRRRKRDVLDQLPAIRHDIIHVDETDGVRKALEAERMLDIDPTDLSGINAAIMGHISTVRMMMGLAMAPQAASYVDYVLQTGEEKVVVFAWHIGVLDILEEALSSKGYSVVRVDGSTTSLAKQRAVDAFVTGTPRVFLGNLQSIGVGVDGLQKVCSRAVFAESSWTPSDNDQGVGRLERIGQKSAIICDWLVAPGSLSERVLGTSLAKLQDIHQAMDERIV